MSTNFDFIRDICMGHGFKQKQKAFFRIYGDGVFQVLKYEFTHRPFYTERLLLGIFSMYGELQSQWFSCTGCIPRYDSRYIKIPRYQRGTWHNGPTVSGKLLQTTDLEDELIFHLDCAELETDILPFLNGMDSQAQLCNGLDYLEARESPVLPQTQEDYFRWNDLEKFAPFLATGRYEDAERVIHSILRQHQTAAKTKSAAYIAEMNKEDSALYQKLSMVEQRNISAIQTYLQNNYAINCRYAAKVGL